MRDTLHRTEAAALVALVMFVSGCSSGSATQPETMCNDEQDNDGDGQTDCADPDCWGHVGCTHSPSDASVHDGALATDGGQGTGCSRDCSEHPLFNQCEMGLCENSSTLQRCCVSQEVACHALLTIGSLYEDQEVNYRGIYDDSHMCTARVLESMGRMEFIFLVQTSGPACSYGHMRLHIGAHLTDLPLGQSLALCGDGAPSSLRVSLEMTPDGAHSPEIYNNQGCTVPGSLRITALGDETGQGYAFELSGTLSHQPFSGDPGPPIDVQVASDGLLEVRVGD
jgi:hypothetical protein